jgi:hypothetical protein
MEPTTRPPDRPEPRDRETPRTPACPVCGGPLFEVRAKLQCARCRTICETCCEGGRG